VWPGAIRRSCAENWWLTYPLKNDGVKVSLDDEIPNLWKIIQMFQTTNQNSIVSIVSPRIHWRWSFESHGDKSPNRFRVYPGSTFRLEPEFKISQSNCQRVTT
jgi:hypothetical protein